MIQNAITQGAGRDLTLDADDVLSKKSTSALADLTSQIQDAAAAKALGHTVESRTSTLTGRAELREAVLNEAARIEPGRPIYVLAIDKETARNWADLDASDYGRLRGPERKEVALEAIAGHMRASPEYADEIKRRSPLIAEAAGHLNENLAKLETERFALAAESKREGAAIAAMAARLAAFDTDALMRLSHLRVEQSRGVAEKLQAAPDLTTSETARRIVDSSDLVGSAQAAQRSAAVAIAVADIIQAESATLRPIKRAITEHEVSADVLARYIVSRERKGLLDRGHTEFSFKEGDRAGQVAFVDAGKSLRTALEDKQTVRVMVEVATSKNWKEITVSGTDEFRRAAWLEGRSQGLEVSGYEPREADKKMLADRQYSKARDNALTVVERVQIRNPDERMLVTPAAKQASRGGEHVDADKLTPREQTVVDNSRALMKEHGIHWGDQAVKELASRLRGERIYVGELVRHGAAPYKFDDKEDASYYVTLKTPKGEQTVWGKQLSMAMQNTDVQRGEQIVLKNVGKEAVEVMARQFDRQGKELPRAPVASQRNEWSVRPLADVNLRGRDVGAQREPSLQRFDAQVARSVTPSAPSRDPSLDVPSRSANRPPLER